MSLQLGAHILHQASGRQWNDAMKPFPETPELLAVAERVVWFKAPREALAGPVHFLAHVMTYGTVEDLRALNGIIGPSEFLNCWTMGGPACSTPGRGLTGT